MCNLHLRLFSWQISPKPLLQLALLETSYLYTASTYILLHHCVLFVHAFPHCQNYLIHLLFYCISPSSRTLSLQAQMPRVTGSLFISLGPRTKTGIQESLNKHSLKEWVNGFLSRFSHFLCKSFTHIPLYTWIWSFPDYLQLSFNWKFHKGVPILTYIPWLYCIYWNQSIKFQNS